MLDRIPDYVWKILILILWGGIIIGFNVIRFDSFGIDEGAAMALLLNWSVQQQIAIPVHLFGAPDFRGLLFVPLGLYWPGSIIAAKVFTLLFSFAAALMLHRWCMDKEDKEPALIATGLFLVSPALIHLVDSISIGPYLLALFGAGVFLDRKYRASPHKISSLYFLQMLLVATTVTLHPMGLAYPVALAWSWYKNPKSERQMKQVWTGLAITVLVILAIQAGWIAVAWQSNPLTSLHHAVLGVDKTEPLAEHWILGIILLALLAYLAYRDYKKLSDDLMGSMLLVAAVTGLLAADLNWALIVLTIILYRGISTLIVFNKSFNANHFLGQRGLVFGVMMILAIAFMQANKHHAFEIANEILSPKEMLIARLAEEAADKDRAFLAASQWPAQTMIACKREVFSLPPAQETGEQLKDIIKNITHIMFDHRDLKNRELARNIAELGGYTETIERQPHGVIVKIRSAAEKTVSPETLPAPDTINEKNQEDKVPTPNDKPPPVE